MVGKGQQLREVATESRLHGRLHSIQKDSFIDIEILKAVTTVDYRVAYRVDYMVDYIVYKRIPL